MSKTPRHSKAPSKSSLKNPHQQACAASRRCYNDGNMSPFFKRTKDTRCGVIISIKSGSVEGSIILSSHRQKLPVVVYTSETLMPLRADAEPDRVLAMRRALFSVMVALAQDGMKVLYAQQKRARVDRVLVSCGAPWSNTITQRIHFEQDAPFTVTPRLVDEIILHAYKKETARTPERARAPQETLKSKCA